MLGVRYTIKDFDIDNFENKVKINSVWLMEGMNLALMLTQVAVLSG